MNQTPLTRENAPQRRTVGDNWNNYHREFRPAPVQTQVWTTESELVHQNQHRARKEKRKTNPDVELPNYSELYPDN